MVETQSSSQSPDLKAKAAELGHQIQDQAKETVRTSAEAAGDKIREAADAAKRVASSAAEQLQESAGRRQASGADYLERFAGHMREASQVFAADAPLAERGITLAADYVENAASTLRDGSPRDLVSLATDFARRQPAAFLGVSALAGFAIMRFLKASEGPVAGGAEHRED